MTEEERAQLEKWQYTDGGRAELAIHGLDLIISDLEQSACNREGFSAIRKTRARLIAARSSLDNLIEATSLFHAEAAE